MSGSSTLYKRGPDTIRIRLPNYTSLLKLPTVYICSFMLIRLASQPPPQDSELRLDDVLDTPLL